MRSSVRSLSSRRAGYRLRSRIASALRFAAAALVLLALASPLRAAASPVSVVMTGVWTLVDDAGAVLGGAILPGSAFSATLVYDDATPDSNASPLYGNYFVAPAQFAFTLGSGGFTFSHVPGGVNEIDVIDPGTGDSVAVYAETFTTSPPLPPLGLNYANVFLDDPSGTALSSDALTAVPWSMAAWSAAAMTFFADIDDGNPLTYFDLEGEITGLTVVPEPASFGMLALGLTALACGARWRR